MVHREGAAMDKTQKGKKFPTRIRNDLDRLWDDEGGPAELQGFDRNTFSFGDACDRFPYIEVAALLRSYCVDERSCRAHWPWIALVANLYRFEAEERSAYEELKPGEVASLFQRISDAAKTLRDEFERLRVHSTWLSDPKKPEARGHLAYLHELFKQQALGDIDTELVDDDLVQIGTDRMQAEFVWRLAKIRFVADEFVAKRVDKDLLERSRGQADQALPPLVLRLAQVWKSHTGRVPSANKVHNRDDERSDFVRFVGSVVDLAGGPIPSRAAVHTALK